MRALLLTAFLTLCFSSISFGQCNQSLFINSTDVVCNGDGTSTVTINVTVLFGNGNNSATISYDIGGGNVVAIVMEDDNGDIIDQTYIFNVPSCDNFTVTLTGWTNPSGSGSSCTDPPPVTAPIILPVLFGDLGLKLNGSNVEIKWSTYSEINNEKFEIQKSIDNLYFQTVGELKGHINSTKKIDYQFTDRLFEKGTYYYKIKQIDLDGNFSFSEYRKVIFKNQSSIEIYPNPAQEYISLSTINYDQYKIHDALGNVIKHVNNAYDNTQIDISNLEKGIYFLISIDGEERISFIKQ